MAAIGQDFTERLLRDAGLCEGQRVLDIGCGSGDLSIFAGQVVGEGGSVVGVDRDLTPLEIARKRARAENLPQVTFHRAAAEELSDAFGPFDLVIGRRVLMYQADPVVTLRKLARCLKPGGCMAFHEHDFTMTPARGVDLPIHRRVQGWVRRTVEREGADTAMGFGLYGALTAAGLQVEEVRAEAVVQTPTQPYDLIGIVRAILPRMIAAGVVGSAEVDLDQLATRLEAERRDSGATYVADMMFGALARKD